MANRDTTPLSYANTSSTEQEPVLPRSDVATIQSNPPTLVTGDVESMSFTGTLNEINKTLRAFQGVINTGRQIERTIFGGNRGNNSNNYDQRAEAAFGNELTKAAKTMSSSSFQNASPLEQQVWATNETIRLERLYSQMDRRSQGMYQQTYTQIQNSLDTIRSGNPYSNDPYNSDPYSSTYNPRPTTPRTTQTTDRAEIAFVTDLQKAYKEMGAQGFNKNSAEWKSLWAIREASESETKFNNMTPESQQKYLKAYQNFRSRLSSLGAPTYSPGNGNDPTWQNPGRSMSYSDPSSQNTVNRPTNGLYSALQPTTFEESLEL